MGLAVEKPGSRHMPVIAEASRLYRISARLLSINAHKPTIYCLALCQVAVILAGKKCVAISSHDALDIAKSD